MRDRNCSDLDIVSLDHVQQIVVSTSERLKSDMSACEIWDEQIWVIKRPVWILFLSRALTTRIDRTDSPTPEYSSVSGGLLGANYSARLWNRYSAADFDDLSGGELHRGAAKFCSQRKSVQERWVVPQWSEEAPSSQFKASGASGSYHWRLRGFAGRDGEHCSYCTWAPIPDTTDRRLWKWFQASWTSSWFMLCWNFEGMSIVSVRCEKHDKGLCHVLDLNFDVVTVLCERRGLQALILVVVLFRQISDIDDFFLRRTLSCSIECYSIFVLHFWWLDDVSVSYIGELYFRAYFTLSGHLLGASIA